MRGCEVGEEARAGEEVDAHRGHGRAREGLGLREDEELQVVQCRHVCTAASTRGR